MKIQRWLFRMTCCVIVAGYFSVSMEAHAQEKVFRAGASVSNITPYLGDGIVGNFGTPPPAMHIHDQLSARALVLDDGTNKLIFVLCDNVSINREVFDEAKKLINEKTQLPKANMLMAATHTHSGTSAGGEGEKRRGWHPDEPLDEYQRFLAHRIADGVQVAINNLEPAKIGWGTGSVPQHLFNRRWKMKPGTPTKNPFGGTDQAVMNPGVGNPNLLEPAGTTDPGVSFISVQSVSGRPIAVLANYSLHYVGGLPDNHISADYFAVFADRMQELLKADRQDPPFVGIMSNGTSGDVNNINVKGSPEKLPHYQKMRLVANDVATEVLRVYKTIKHQDWVGLKAVQSELSLKVRRPDAGLVKWAQGVLSRPDSIKPNHPLEKTYAQRSLQMQEWPDNISVILQAFRIGDLGIAAIPFETFAETGLEIKAKSPFNPSFTIELANGGYGYLPTPEQHQLGGYETWLSTNRVETEASRKIVAELLLLFSRLK
ncbi:neutral/alkaline non-lysosomal ceramidase N-terminal domain-containing protein [Dyadobacter bucti]|uniref:neutral/alkaline non-lysosomal ceramidase N-terminal domain-containing protein n=1 Tax=Dyadobacter bucti TaxID=2572203 RepID=UPI0011084FE0|nr:neutral/alkaline non-lysosomal ceramidase N-terminal domain-containing protein [Dyadobacter bucti]